MDDIEDALKILASGIPISILEKIVNASVEFNDSALHSSITQCVSWKSCKSKLFYNKDENDFPHSG